MMLITQIFLDQGSPTDLETDDYVITLGAHSRPSRNGDVCRALPQIVGVTLIYHAREERVT